MNNSKILNSAVDFNQSVCKAIQKILRSNIKQGIRNQIVVRLAAACRLAGFDEEFTKRLLLQWNEKNKINLKEYEITNPIKTLYRKAEAYHFHCNDQLLEQFCPYQKNNREECSVYSKARELLLIHQAYEAVCKAYNTR